LSVRLTVDCENLRVTHVVSEGRETDPTVADVTHRSCAGDIEPPFPVEIRIC
jgi:hypothetical protein